MSTVDATFQFYSVPEAARELGLTDGRVRQLLLAGHLQGRKLGGNSGKNWVIPAVEVRRLKDEREKNNRRKA